MKKDDQPTTPHLTDGAAAELVEILKTNVDRDSPYQSTHIARSHERERPQRELTPIFYGCFDWHSAVHSHWSLARLAGARPTAPWAAEVRELLDRRLCPAAVEAEHAFLAAPERACFELPYGLAWLLALDQELAHHPALRGRLAPLAALAAERLADWLHRLDQPSHSGEHDQSAFAMGLALDWARAGGEVNLASAIERRAIELYVNERVVRAPPVDREPAAHDFLSPALGVADLMARLLPDDRLEPWLRTLLTSVPWQPVEVVDRNNGKLAHAAGLNFSRAWMMRAIAQRLAPGRLRSALTDCVRSHESAFWSPAPADSYAVTHWVPTFVVRYYLPAT